MILLKSDIALLDGFRFFVSTSTVKLQLHKLIKILSTSLSYNFTLPLNFIKSIKARRSNDQKIRYEIVIHYALKNIGVDGTGNSIDQNFILLN